MSLRLAHDAAGRTRVHVRWTEEGLIELYEAPADAVSPADYRMAETPRAEPAPGAPVFRITVADARTLERELMGAAVHAEYFEDRVTGRVDVEWCRPDGRAVRETPSWCVGRIVARTATAVRLVVTPPKAWKPPPHGWPASGWYRIADGWPLDHPPRRRGWRAVGELAPRPGEPAPPALEVEFLGGGS